MATTTANPLGIDFLKKNDPNAQMRFNMIEQQIRPWDVLDLEVLELLWIVKRENFVPAEHRRVAFADLEIPLPGGQRMLSPKVEARVLQDLAVRKHETVLEIGTGSGYMAALLAHRALKVVSVEINPELAELARRNLRENGVENVEVVVGDGAGGWPAAAPYDVIAVSAGMPMLPNSLLQQLKPGDPLTSRRGGRLSAFVGTAPVMQAQLVTRVDETEFHVIDSFDTYVAPLQNAIAPPRFQF